MWLTYSWIVACAFFGEGCMLELLNWRVDRDVGLQHSRVVVC